MLAREVDLGPGLGDLPGGLLVSSTPTPATRFRAGGRRRRPERRNPGRVLQRGQVPQGAVRPLLVVAASPFLDGLSSILQIREPVLVQALVPELAVEALDVRVLDGAPRCDEVQLDPVPVGPGGERRACKLRDRCGPAGCEIGELLQAPKGPAFPNWSSYGR
jgi:hypothetical protein